MDVPAVFDSSIAAAMRSLDQRQSVDETLRTIAMVTRNSVPGFDQIGITTLHKNRSVVTRAAIGNLALQLDDIQHGLWEGPSVDALQGLDMMTAPASATPSGGRVMRPKPLP